MKTIFDEVGAMDRVAGDKELLVELFEIAFEDTPLRIEKIEVAIESGDATTVAETAHAMKSAFGNIGAVRCHELSFELEKTGKAGEIQSASQILSQLKQELETFERAADAFRNS
jgi:HPt (histidine-containing phosphotransfer) domain-containing protein